MSAGLMVLYSLLEPLKSEPVSASAVKNQIEETFGEERKMSKQSITNAAKRLEEINVIDRSVGYSVNYGRLIAVLLRALIRLSESVSELEEEVAALKAGQRRPS